MVFNEFFFFLQIYGEEFGLLPSSFLSSHDNKGGRKDRRSGRKVSDQSSSQTSPARRKDSTARRG